MAKIMTGKTFAGKEISYEVVSDGYNIYLGGNETPWIKQYEPNYIPDRSLSYEENAIKQIDEICAGEEASENKAADESEA